MIEEEKEKIDIQLKQEDYYSLCKFILNGEILGTAEGLIIDEDYDEWFNHVKTTGHQIPPYANISISFKVMTHIEKILDFPELVSMMKKHIPVTLKRLMDGKIKIVDTTKEKKITNNWKTGIKKIDN